MVLLPDVVVARGQHGYALYNAKRGTLTPSDLNGKRVGIRSFTTTTGAWLRGILANDHGVDLDSIDWVTFEDAHVAGIRRHHQARAGGQADRADAARRRARCRAGREGEHPDLKPLFPDVAAEEKAWSAKHGISPINHMVVVGADLSRTIPMSCARCTGCSPNPLPPQRVPAIHAGPDAPLAANDHALRRAAKADSAEFSVDELFDDVTRALT